MLFLVLLIFTTIFQPRLSLFGLNIVVVTAFDFLDDESDEGVCNMWVSEKSIVNHFVDNVPCNVLIGETECVFNIVLI